MVILTLVELCEKMKQIDEITLLEILNVESADLVERFIDVIEDNFDKFSEDMSE
jgi:tRNA A37 methylthiotransferase MiaB